MELLYNFFISSTPRKYSADVKQAEIKSKRIITRLHDKHYDFTDFKHPGGPIPIALIKNRDGTEIFESHHLFTSVNIEKILKKYELAETPEPEIPASNVFNWKKTKSSPFTKELHDIARKELGKEIKMTWFRVFEIFVMLMFTFSQIYFYWQGNWFSLFTMPLAVWILAVNTFHDGSHFALSWNWRINRLGTNLGFMFSTPYTWYHQHVIGHHSFPNIPGKDPDLYHAPKMIRHSKDVKHRSAHKYQAITFIISWLLGVPFSLIWHGIKQSLTRKFYNRVVAFNKSKYLNTSSLVLRFIFYFSLTHLLPFFLHGLTLKAFLFSIVPIYSFSLYFMISSQINHLTPHTHEQYDDNFFVHQIKTACDVATDNYFVYLFTGGLNMQIEHHLFPSVNHCHLKKLIPKVKEICKKHGVVFNESPTLWHAICEHVKHLKKFALE